MAMPRDLNRVISSGEVRAGALPSEHLADLADDVVVADEALALGDEELAGLAQQRLALVGVQPRLGHER